MEFKDYLKILYRRRLWVLGTLLTFTAIYGSYLTYEPQLYRATAKMILRRSDPVLSIMGGVTYSPKVLSYRTQMSVAQSMPVCRLVSERMQYRVSPEEIQSAVQLDKEGETEIVRLEVRFPDGRLAEEIANRVIEAFTTYDDEQVRRGATSAIQFLSEQIERLNREELPETEERLRRFRREKRIYDLSEQIRLDLKRLAEGEASAYEIEFQIGELQTEAAQMEREIREFVAACEQVLAEGSEAPRSEWMKRLLGDEKIPHPDLLLSLKERVMGEGEMAPGARRVREIEEEMASVRIARRSLLATYTEHHPQVREMERRIASLEEGLAAALAEDGMERALRRRFASYGALLSRRSEIAALTDKRQRIQEMVERLRERLGAISDDEIEYLNLSRQFSQTKERLASLMQKRSDLELERRRIEGNVFVYEPASPGSARAIPKRSAKALPFWILTAVVASIGVAYLTDLMDTTLRTDYQVSRYLNLPILGTVPYVDARGERLLIQQPLRTSLMEEFSRIATFFPSQFEQTGAKVFMVVSFNEEEGKSTTVSNLGVAFARNGYTTVLADGDMRKPKLHDFFEVEVQPGLSELLDGSLDAAEQARKIAGGEGGAASSVEEILGRVLARPSAWKGDGLYVVPSGTVPENPAGLLRSENCLRFLDEIRASADVVLVDVPPLIGAADALILAPLVDGVLFLIEAGVTTREEATHGKKMIENAGGRIVGCILNKAREMGISSYYYYYARGYGYARRQYGSTM